MNPPQPRSRKGPVDFFVQAVFLTMGAADRWGNSWATAFAGLALVSIAVTVVMLVRDRIK